MCPSTTGRSPRTPPAPTLLVSIHVNASPDSGASGAAVYHHATAGAGPEVDVPLFVPWEQAQDRFVAASRSLAEAVAAELASAGLGSGAVADAPLRVLRGAAMPAVQVALGFRVLAG